MSYLRSNGHVSGRIGGPGTGLSFGARYSLGAVDTIASAGAGPIVHGDATTALIAQVNRFGHALPLATGTVSYEAATFAVTYLQQRLIAAMATSVDSGTLKELERVNAAFANPIPFVMADRERIAQVLALYADQKGLPSAKVGIVSSGIKGLPLAIAAGAAALFLITRKRR